MFKEVVAGVLLGTSVLFAQGKSEETDRKLFHPDSTITIELEDIIIEAEKKKVKSPEAEESGFMTVYYNDANKIAMSEYSGVFSIIPVYSRLRINNMDPKFTGMTYQDIPLIIDNTQLHGGISIINSQMSKLQIQKTAYSSKYNSIGGILEIFPKEYEVRPAVLLSSDFIERSVLYSDKFKLRDINIKTTTALRNIGIPAPLENIVEELKILPDIYEASHNTILSKNNYESEIFFRISDGSGEFYDENEDIKLNEHSSKNFFLTRQSLQLHDGLWASLKFAYERNNTIIDYDFVSEANHVKNHNKNITFAASLDSHNFSIGSRIFLLTNANSKEYEEKTLIDIYGEYKQVIGNVLLEPSLRIIKNEDFWRTSQGIAATYFINNSSFGVAYGHPVNMLVVNNSSGEKEQGIAKLGDQFADHYAGFLNIRSADIDEKLKDIIDEIDISYYHKDFRSYADDNIDKGYVRGLDFMVRNFGESHYSIKYSTGKAILNGERMTGAVEDILNIDTGFPAPFIRNLLMNLQYTYNGGYNVRIKSVNQSETVGKAHYISAGLTYKFSVLGSDVDVSVTLFNLLRFFGYTDVPEFARYKIGDNIKSIKMPPLGNIRLNMDIKF